MELCLLLSQILLKDWVVSSLLFMLSLVTESIRVNTSILHL